MSYLKIGVAAAVIWGLAVTLSLHTAAAQDATAPSAAACENMFRQKIDQVNLLSSAVVPAAGDLPAYCRVLGYVRPAINFEVRMPISNWNGKFYMTGCGGFCGALLSDLPGFANAMNYGLRRGYAVSTMDSGHWGTGSSDGRWANNNRLAEIDWGWRAVTETARTTKALIKGYYGSEQKRSYFAGCSTGGRMAAMEAQRFPNDFDGIISGAPALDYTGLVATWATWTSLANLDKDGKEILGRSKVKMIGDAVLKACAGPDGVVDDPAMCNFEPKSLQCKGKAGDDCLTEAEVGVMEKWYSGPRDDQGKLLYPGQIPKGSERFWPLWLTGNTQGSAAILPLFAINFDRYMAFPEDPGENFTLQQFDFKKDPPRLATMSAIYNATNPDLSKFKERGGKLIMYHGLADSLLPPGITLQYWQSVVDKMGSPGAVADFYRLFLVPGFDHCGIQPGLGIVDTGMDPLTALEQWVENGQAPATLITTKKAADGSVERVRPLCPYPAVPKFKSGDRNDPSNYECVGR